MNTKAAAIFDSLDPSVFEKVARGALDDPHATLIGRPALSEIPAPHNDLRTIAIIKAEGRAKSHGSEAGWSSVAKVIDTSADSGSFAHWLYPEKEAMVYEHRLFSADGLCFRPARCYLVSSLDPGLKIFWLEDLTNALGTPFTAEQLKSLVRNLGEFNGFHSARQVELPFEPAKDSYLTRWQTAGFRDRVARVSALQDTPEVRRTFGPVPVNLLIELHELLDELARRSRDLEHSLSFGDCQPGNLFALENETVAIDWASLTFDPTGVDAGCLIGSAMTWGKRGGEIAEAEQDLFECYLEGLSDGGWEGDPANIRRAFFGQFGTYLMAVGTVPTFLSEASDDEAARLRDFVEKRFQTAYEDIPDLLAPVISRFPRYVEEVSQLLE